MDATTEIVDGVRQLKIDRDTWQAVALQYKTAFETQTARLRELQDICFATQAELQNERIQHRRLQMNISDMPRDRPLALHSDKQPPDDQAFGTVMIFSPKGIDTSWRLTTPGESENSIFGRVQQFASHLDHGRALVEIEGLLRGPLSPQARVEGLLLKSNILQATGPDCLYDALAACSEAIELCDRLSDLQTLLPRIQYQRGLYYYQLRMLQQAREAFGAASEDDSLSERADQYAQSCDAELETILSDGRSAFDEDRSCTGDLLIDLEDGSSRGRLRRTSAQFKHRATQKVKRMSFPQRWVTLTTDGASKTGET